MGRLEKFATDRIARSRNLAQIVAEVRIGHYARRDLRRQHGCGDRGLDPVVDGEARSGDGVAGGLELAGGLETPTLAERSDGCGGERGGEEKGEQQRQDSRPQSRANLGVTA